jgi:hypothetical protein
MALIAKSQIGMNWNKVEICEANIYSYLLFSLIYDSN